jgi:CRP-like cAMP-binding protein
MPLTDDPPFGDLLRPDDDEALRARAGVRRFKPGASLMYEGQAGDEVILLTEGHVKVTRVSEGKEVVLRFCGPGELIGELAVIDDQPRSGTVHALETVEALALSAADFMALVESRPGIARALLKDLVRRFRDANRKRIDFAASQTLARVASRIVELAERYGERDNGGITIRLPISQEELAGWTGSSREAVAKALHTLRELDLVTTERRRMTVLDLEGLSRQAA